VCDRILGIFVDFSIIVHSTSSDGKQVSWALASMAAPVSSSEFKASQQGQLLPVAPSCASFAAHETDSFVLGTEQVRSFVSYF
jgi:hypothetical protein